MDKMPKMQGFDDVIYSLRESIELMMGLKFLMEYAHRSSEEIEKLKNRMTLTKLLAAQLMMANETVNKVNKIDF